MENENPIRFIAVVVVVVAAVSHNAQHMLLFEFICALNILYIYIYFISIYFAYMFQTYEHCAQSTGPHCEGRHFF